MIASIFSLKKNQRKREKGFLKVEKKNPNYNVKTKEDDMMISDLPRDLAEEILSRLPLTSMRTVRLTCKKWDTLSKSRSFTKLHISKLAAEREGESSMIVMVDYNLYRVKVVVNEHPSKEVQGKLISLNDSKQVQISQIFHCEGLLLCTLEDDITRVVVWNPYLGQRRSIEVRYYFRAHDGLSRHSYAIGYENKKNKSFRSYKILRFVDDYYDDYPGHNHFLWYEIYDFDIGLWKNLDVTSPHWLIGVSHRGVTLKGNTYWIAGERVTNRLNDYIICFDFTTERFGPLMPLPVQSHMDEFVSLSCVREEKLVVLFQHEDSYVEMWITTQIEAENVLWSKLLIVDIRPVANIPFFFMHGNFFIDEKKKVAITFDKFRGMSFSKLKRHTVNIIGEDGYFRELDLGESKENWWMASVCSYVPSLVQIEQQGGKRKKTRWGYDPVRELSKFINRVGKKTRWG